MTYTANKNNNQWTDKHDAFCLENKLTPCAKTLWAWLIRQKDDEPDLKEFNKWAEKHRGKGYCRLTIKTAFNQLVECRVIQLLKQFTWHLVRIATRTLDELFPKKNLRRENKIYSEQTSNQADTYDDPHSSSIPQYTDEDKQEIHQECTSVGINFNYQKPNKIYNHSREDISLAISYYRRYKGKIINPIGWLIECLEWRYWEDSIYQINTDLYALQVGKRT